MKIPRSFARANGLLVLFLISVPSIGLAQSNLVTTSTYQGYGSAGFPNQKAVAIGSDGFARFVIGDSSLGGFNDEIIYLRCLDADCSTFNTTTFTPGSWTGGFSIAIGPDGYARIAYSTFGTLDPDPFSDAVDRQWGGTLGFIQCSNADCSSSTSSWVAPASDNGVSSIAVGSDGTAYIVYDDGNDHDGPQGIGLATCVSGSCGTTHITDISIYDAIGGAIAIGADGSPAIAYIDYSYDGESTVHYYANSSDNVISSDVSYGPDLTVASDGFARVLFTNYAETAVNFIQCANVSCSSFNTDAISPSGFGGGYASGAVGADGNAIIEFSMGGYPSSVGYVQCTAADCSSHNDEEVSVLSDNSDGVVSLALGSDSLPRMMAQDITRLAYQLRGISGVPVDFTQVSASDLGNGDLHFLYSWHSSTGNLADLSSCVVGEIVTFPGANPFLWPSPPFPPNSSPNPTIINVPGSDGKMTDDQRLYPNTAFVIPYSAVSFTGTQYYRYKCAGDISYTTITGPNYIFRKVDQHSGGGSWYFTVTKSGSSATIDPLP